jgi:hypothetical protein
MEAGYIFRKRKPEYHISESTFTEHHIDID